MPPESQPLILVDRHHKVLPGWAAFRASLASAPRLITLDHHTDTSKPFRNHIKRLQATNGDELRETWLRELDFAKPESVLAALQRLNNDEHIVTAIQSGIISSAFVVAHNACDTDLATYREHKIMCRGVDRKPNSTKLVRADYDKVLESDFLSEVLKSFDSALAEIGEPALSEVPYNLDIDLDYFNTAASIAPLDSRAIVQLARDAGLISIATEPDYVESCAVEPGLTSEFLLERLQTLLA